MRISTSKVTMLEVSVPSRLTRSTTPWNDALGVGVDADLDLLLGDHAADLGLVDQADGAQVREVRDGHQRGAAVGVGRRRRHDACPFSTAMLSTVPLIGAKMSVSLRRVSASCTAQLRGLQRRLGRAELRALERDRWRPPPSPMCAAVLAASAEPERPAPRPSLGQLLRGLRRSS